MSKLTLAQAKRQIELLKADVKMWRERAEAPEHAAEVFAADARKILDWVPPRPRYGGRPAQVATESLIDALYQVEAERWDEHHVRAVFELCELAGMRPASATPEDIAEAAESLAFKYRRR
jgi:hypothetical protein